jgi:hypothetical protein
LPVDGKYNRSADGRRQQPAPIRKTPAIAGIFKRLM